MIFKVLLMPFFPARNGLSFSRALGGTVAWPEPALHHCKHSVIIPRAEARISTPASRLRAELEKRLERFGWTGILPFLLRHCPDALARYNAE